MEEFGFVVALFILLCLAGLLVIGAETVHDSMLISQCEFVNAAQNCHKVFLPENHEYFKED